MGAIFHLIRTWLLAFIAILIMPIASVAQEKRVALVIGNGAYVKVPKLPNPPNDALAMAGLLRKAAFEVVEQMDLGVDAMRRALRDFSDEVRDADIAVVFYAGHGIEMNGVNYLIPIDATIAGDVDVEDETISLDRVIRTIEPARRLQLVLLDACRDNPFVRSMRRTTVSRSLRSGHGDIDERALPPNTLIAYAQKAGSTADDGEGANSPYTTALLKNLATPGLDVELALRRVRDEVLRATKNRQEPFKYGSLSGTELPLVPGAVTPSASSADTKSMYSPSEVAQFCQSVATNPSTAVLQSMLEDYKGTQLAHCVQARIDELKRQEVAIAAPPEKDKKPPLPNLIDKTLGTVLPPSVGACNGIEVSVGQNERRCFKPGAGKTEHFKDCPTCPEMVVVPSGTFIMGADANEEGTDPSERPQHSVFIPRDIAVGAYQITREEFEQFAQVTDRKLDGCWISCLSL
jgi:hypothetical protein